MILKSPDERADDIQTLKTLLNGPRLTGRQHKAVEKELIRVRSGLKGEREAAYHIDFHCGNSDNYAVIHDLRLEQNGHVAQIDHLVIGRFLSGYICETKYWSSGVSINANGEFSALYGHRTIGVPSPIAQNARHIKILDETLTSGQVFRPKRLGITLPVTFSPVTLVSTGATITRPKGKAGEPFSQLVKADQFFEYIHGHFEARLSSLMLGKIVSTNTLRRVAQSLVDLHTPIKMNYAAKFGIETSHIAKASPTRPQTQTARTYQCARCGTRVDVSVARFCWHHKPRFNSQILCLTHQNNAKADSVSSR